MSFIRPNYYFKISEEMQQRELTTAEKRDFNSAISIAQSWVMDVRHGSGWAEDKALGWLYEAVSYKPTDIDIAQVINLDEFLSAFYRVTSSYLFHDIANPFLDALIRNKTIKELKLSCNIDDGFSEIFNYANSNLAAFIAGTKSLEKLDISTCNNPGKLKAEDMTHIANGLKFNTSIEEINIQRQPIGDEGLIILLDALASNSKARLKKINLLQTGITDKGANVLIQFLKNHLTLVSVKLKLEHVQENENQITESKLVEIKNLIKKNKSAHRQYTKGAMFGLFSALNLPPELGWQIGDYLSRETGRNVALASKTAATVARAEEAKIKMSKF